MARRVTAPPQRLNSMKAHFGPDDDIAAELPTLRAWMKQSYIAMAPKKLARQVSEA